MKPDAGDSPVPPAKGLCPSALPIGPLGQVPDTGEKRPEGRLVANVSPRPDGERARGGRAHAVRPYGGRRPHSCPRITSSPLARKP